jgi:hypothetical protein
MSLRENFDKGPLGKAVDFWAVHGLPRLRPVDAPGTE